jgi:integration host factor subunit beta
MHLKGIQVTRSELISAVASRQAHLVPADAAVGVKSLLALLSDALAEGQRVEIRGFGVFTLRYRPPRLGRNPKTGAQVSLPGRYALHFKPGDRLRSAVYVI